MFVSHQTALATGSLTSWLCATAKKTLPTTAPARAPAASTVVGGAEYVALTTTNAEGGSEASQDEKTIPSAPAPALNQTVVSKVLQFAARDLRVRVGFFVVGLWILNEICEGLPWISLLSPLQLLTLACVSADPSKP